MWRGRCCRVCADVFTTFTVPYYTITSGTFLSDTIAIPYTSQRLV